MATKTKKQVQKKVEFDFRSITSFNDACNRLGINDSIPDVAMLPEEFRKPVIAGYRLMIIYKAINNGWKPDWNNYSEYKYYPWFEVLSSGFGFSDSYYTFVIAHTDVGSRLCTDTSEKAMYIAKQFEAEYKEYFLFEN